MESHKAHRRWRKHVRIFKCTQSLSMRTAEGVRRKPEVVQILNSMRKLIQKSEKQTATKINRGKKPMYLHGLVAEVCLSWALRYEENFSWQRTTEMRRESAHTRLLVTSYLLHRPCMLPLLLASLRQKHILLFLNLFASFTDITLMCKHRMLWGSFSYLLFSIVCGTLILPYSFLKLFIIVLYVFWPAYVCVPHAYLVPTAWEESIRSSEVGVTDSCQLLPRVLGTEFGSSARVASVLNSQAISPAPLFYGFPLLLLI